MSDIIKLIEQMGTEFQGFAGRNDIKVAAMQRQLETLENAVATSQFQGGGSPIGRGVSSVAAKEHKNKFISWVRKGSDPEGLRGLEVQASLSSDDDPSGGFLVPVETSKELDRVAADSVAMRRICKTITASGDYQRPFSNGGATGGWVGEKEDRTTTDTPELKMFNPPWSEWYALPEITQTLLDMAGVDIESWLNDELQIVESEMEGEAFIRGNGVKQPKGILAYDTVANAGWSWGKVGYITSGAASTLNDCDKLMALQHSLKPVYRRKMIWLMNDNTLETVRKFKDGDGNYIFRAGLSENAPDTLFGKPIEIDDNMDDIGAGKFPIAVADWQRFYCIGDHKVGRRILRDPFTKKGWVLLYLTKRVFGGIINHQAGKLLKISV